MTSTRLAGLLGFGLVAATAYLGLWSGIEEWAGVRNGWQRLATVVELGYGALAALAVLAALGRRPMWARAVLVPWAVVTTVAGTLAPIVWGEAGWMAGAASGVAAALICALTVWLCRRWLRTRDSIAVQSSG